MSLALVAAVQRAAGISEPEFVADIEVAMFAAEEEVVGC